MQINIKATGIELTPAIRDYVEKKVGKISNYIKEGESEAIIHVEVGKPSEHHHAGNVFRAELQLSFRGIGTRVEEMQTDLYTAIDLASDELIRIVTAKKDKNEALFRRGARRIKGAFKRFYR